jgi:hypothetical protein
MARGADKGLFVFPTLSVTFWRWFEKVGWGVSKPNRAASHTARLWSGQEVGVGTGPESHGRGVNEFVVVWVGCGIVEEAVGGGEVVLSGSRLMGGELADSNEDG